MRKITREIARAFQNREAKTIGNSRTDGNALYLFNNKIAEYREGELWITNAGWNSMTTKERLNGLGGVYIQQVRGAWLLSGIEWDGSWIEVRTWGEWASGTIDNNEVEFDTSSEWMSEGYSKPRYAIFHTLVEASLESVEAKLIGEGIPTKRMESDTSGVYRPNYFVVVRPEDLERAVLCL